MSVKSKYLKSNKKVRNATKCEYDGLEFKSKLELFCYKYAKELGYTLEYENSKTILMQGFRLKGQLYYPSKEHKMILNQRKILSITYSPDFYMAIKNKLGEDIKVVIECKGHPNDAYLLKKKMFLQVWDTIWGQNFYFFEPHTQQQVKECFTIIKAIQR